MACEICGRNSCMRSFHSLEDQDCFDSIADKVKNRIQNIITTRINRLDGHYHGNNYYIFLDDVLTVINDYMN